MLLPTLRLLLGGSPRELLRALSDREVIASLGLTFYCAWWATLVALLLGIPMAYLLARHRFPGKGLVEGIIDLPVVLPHTAAGVALLLVLGRRGLLGRPLAALGVVFTDSIPGIVAGMFFVSAPFLVNAARDAFALISPELERVALTEGATHWQALWHVTLPLARRGILGGALMMWARGISEFGAVVILAYHPRIAPVLVYERFQGFGLDAAIPVAALLVFISLIVFLVLRAILAADGAFSQE